MKITDLYSCSRRAAYSRPDGRYRLSGDPAGGLWHVIGLCRFEPGELDKYITVDGKPLRMGEEEAMY